MQLRLSGITKESVVDGPGLRVVIFVQGCPHNCPGCHNTDTHNPNGGYVAEVADTFLTIAGYARQNKLIRGVTFSGGEPFDQSAALTELASKIKIEKKSFDIITYTGYTFEKLLRIGRTKPGIKELLSYTDILVDGPYLEKERNLLLAYRGSKNQRLIDVKLSLETGKTVLYSEAGFLNNPAN